MQPMKLTQLITIGLLAILTACSPDKTPTTQLGKPIDTKTANGAIKPGGIYVYKGGDGSLGTLKVLKTEDGSVDVVLYKNRFQTAPSSIDPKTLEVAVKHETLSTKGFQNWQPQMIMEQPVTPAELAE
jgi:hypothetical protein